jgi:prepilin-type N-terminal cleavage/methylation domain-containing protein
MKNWFKKVISSYFNGSKSIKPFFGGTAAVKRNSSLGFTLIELLVVIAIIALLASIVLVALNNTRQKGRDASRAATIKQLTTAMELFFNNNFSYPTTSAAIGTNYCVIGAAGCLTNLVPAYLASLPVAPLPADGICGSSYGTSIGNSYQFAGTNSANTVNNYTITFCLGSTVGAEGSGYRTLTNGGVQ